MKVHLDITIPRQLHQPLETRATMAQYRRATGEYTLYTNTQIPHGNKFMICNLVMGIPYNKLRVIVPAIGGAYGSKGYLYQDAPLMLFLAKEVGRPVKWVDTREGLCGHDGTQPRTEQHATLAGKKDGTITALSCHQLRRLRRLLGEQRALARRWCSLGAASPARTRFRIRSTRLPRLSPTRSASARRAAPAAWRRCS